MVDESLLFTSSPPQLSSPLNSSTVLPLVEEEVDSLNQGKTDGEEENGTNGDSKEEEGSDDEYDDSNRKTAATTHSNTAKAFTKSLKNVNNINSSSAAFTAFTSTSSLSVVAGRVADTAAEHDGEDNVTDQEEEQQEQQQKTIAQFLFTDEIGNLRCVNAIVAYPCTIFWCILMICISLTIILVVFIFVPEGNPFDITEMELDLNDLRSIQYDSFRLAHESTQELYSVSKSATADIPKQSEPVDITYWVFEDTAGHGGGGVFGSEESIKAMKTSFDLFSEETDFHNYCMLIYPDSGSTIIETNIATNPAEVSCRIPLSPLASYYASEWNSTLVANVIEQLKVPGNVVNYNRLAVCYTRGLFCNQLQSNDTVITAEDIEFVLQLTSDITTIISKWDMKSPRLNANFSQVTDFAAHLWQLPVYRGYVDFGYDSNFSISNPVSSYSRGLLTWGGPLESTIVHNDDEWSSTTEAKEGRDELDDEERLEFVVDTFLDRMNTLADPATHRTINSYYFMNTLIEKVIFAVVQHDGMLATFSLSFVFLWLRINIGSWFLAAVGILEIFLSIPLAWFFFRIVFRIKFFAFLNALCIFIVAAIGADDIFIFMDAYKQSKRQFNPDQLASLETRMSWVYRRTGTAMAITSATTCSAFLCTLITPLVTIQSFGIFAAFVIFFDYVLVMSLFCTAVVIYHDRFEDRACSEYCTGCIRNTPIDTELAMADAASQQQESTALRDGNNATGDIDRVSNFFRTKVATFVQNPASRKVLAFLFLSWLGVATWQSTQIEATKAAEQFLDENHPLQKSLTILANEFPRAESDPTLKVYFAFGLGAVNREGVSLLLDPKNAGKPNFLKTFDFNMECQDQLLLACDNLKTNQKYAGLVKQSYGLGNVHCFIEELAAYNTRGNLNDCDYVNSGAWKNESWHINSENLSSVMKGFLEEKSCSSLTETVAGFYNQEIGWDGKELRYVALGVSSKVLNPFSQEPESFVREEYDQFVLIAEELDSTVAKYCGDGNTIMTDLRGKFVFMNNQAIYVQSAVQSSILGVAIAFIVLLISTRVFHIALFASLSIISVLVSVTGSMALLGWSLGSIESILIGIIAGFSVDYVVHLAHAYETAKGDTNDRINAAFGNMGISVLNSMITSVAASIPLFFCQLQFFAKFGTFLCFTIVFSWLFANFVFMSVLAQFKIPLKK